MEKTITVPGQIASCWAAYAAQFDAVYVIDAARPNVTTINPASGDARGQTSFSANKVVENGGSDSRVDRDWLYILSDDLVDPKVVVMKVGTGQVPVTIQEFDTIEQVGKIPGWMGMAIYPNGY